MGTRQADLNFANVQGDRGGKTKDQIHATANAGISGENQFDAMENFTIVVGAVAGMHTAGFGTAFKSTPTL